MPLSITTIKYWFKGNVRLSKLMLRFLVIITKYIHPGWSSSSDNSPSSFVSSIYDVRMYNIISKHIQVFA